MIKICKIEKLVIDAMRLSKPLSLYLLFFSAFALSANDGLYQIKTDKSEYIYGQSVEILLQRQDKDASCTVEIDFGDNNKKILDILKQYPDSIAFTEFNYEEHYNVLAKDINVADEYFCNLKNSDVFMCQGQASFLADAFYNGKYSLQFSHPK